MQEELNSPRGLLEGNLIEPLIEPSGASQGRISSLGRISHRIQARPCIRLTGMHGVCFLLLQPMAVIE